MPRSLEMREYDRETVIFQPSLDTISTINWINESETVFFGNLYKNLEFFKGESTVVDSFNAISLAWHLATYTLRIIYIYDILL